MLPETFRTQPELIETIASRKAGMIGREIEAVIVPYELHVFQLLSPHSEIIGEAADNLGEKDRKQAVVL